MAPPPSFFRSCFNMIQVSTPDVNSWKQDLDNLEQHSKSENLLFHGVQLPNDGTQEDLYISLPLLINQHFVGFNLVPEDISVTHRLSAPRATSDPSRPTRPPPVIVRFTRKSTRNRLLAERRQLKGKPLVVTEHLTAARVQLLQKANQLATSRKIASAWSKDGRIVIKLLSNRVMVIANESDLLPYS
jgi:hypothetical protein